MRKFGLIGYPLSHSFSRNYFSEKFAGEHITGCAYYNFPLEHIDLFTALLRDNPDIEGLNVTIPYKQSVRQFLDEFDITAAEIGAVNCIDIRNGRLKGYNTDAIGFELSLRPLLDNSHARALILGTGGASRAVGFVLTKLGIAFSYVSRTKKKGCLTYEELDEAVLYEHTIIVNTTPLGTFPDIHYAPAIPYHLLTLKHLLYDLVYNPRETLFLQKGSAQGATIKNGYEMLVLQAEASWKIWNGQSPDR